LDPWPQADGFEPVQGSEVEANARNGPGDGRSDSSPKSGKSVGFEHLASHREHPEPVVRLGALDPGLDEIQRLEQYGGAGPREGPGQKGFDHRVSE